MLKALRRHLKSKKTTNFMQYMKINRKESIESSVNGRHLDDIVNDLDNSYYRNSDCFGFIRSNSYNVSRNIDLNGENHSLGKIRLNYQHLHALHRFRRHRKRGISSDKDVVISFLPKLRISIVNRFDFYYRFGKQEQEAIACFDFLYDLQSDTENNGLYEMEISNDRKLNSSLEDAIYKDGDSVHNMNDVHNDTNSLIDQNRLSLSDSCAEFDDQFSDYLVRLD